MNDSEKKQIEADAFRLKKARADVETILRFMRDRGFNQPDSISTLMKITDMDLGEAQDHVVESETWADQYERNLKLQEQLAQALFELSEEDPNFWIISDSEPEEPES